MTVADDNKKRAMPEPVAHAMIVAEFPKFKQKTDYLELVLAQLEAMKIEASGKGDTVNNIDLETVETDVAELVDRVKAIDDAIILCSFLLLGVHNAHNTAGIEQIKQLFISESSATKEAISKGGVVSDLGGGLDGVSG